MEYCKFQITNTKNTNSKQRRDLESINELVSVIEYWILEFICNLVLVFWNFITFCNYFKFPVFKSSSRKSLFTAALSRDQPVGRELPGWGRIHQQQRPTCHWRQFPSVWPVLSWPPQLPVYQPVLQEHTSPLCRPL